MLKSVSLANAMAEALLARGVPQAIAHLAAEMGVLAFHHGFVDWSAHPNASGEELARLTVAALGELKAAAAALT